MYLPKLAGQGAPTLKKMILSNGWKGKDAVSIVAANMMLQGAGTVDYFTVS
jgi:hypothetical protein